MTISYPLTLPTDPAPTKIKIRKVPVVSAPSSPYTGQQQVQVYPGQWWEADVTMPPIDRRKRGRWEAFFGKMNGQEGVVLMGDPDRKMASGAAALSPGMPVTDGAHATQVQTLNISGGPESIVGWLLEGDLIQISTGLDTRLHEILEDVDTDSDGKAALLIWPKIQKPVASGTDIKVNGAMGAFRLSQNVTEVERDTDGYMATGFSCRSAF